MRNDIIFGNGKESVSGSANFVVNFWTTFSSCRVMDEVVFVKGKGVAQELWKALNVSNADVGWRPPPDECIKINMLTLVMWRV